MSRLGANFLILISVKSTGEKNRMQILSPYVNSIFGRGAEGEKHCELRAQYLFDEAVVQTNNLNSTGLVRAKDIIKHNTKGSTNTLILISVKTDRIHIIISTMINSGDVVILMNHRRLTLAIFDSSIAALIVGDVVKTTNHKSFQIFTRITLTAKVCQLKALIIIAIIAIIATGIIAFIFELYQCFSNLILQLHD